MLSLFFNAMCPTYYAVMSNQAVTLHRSRLISSHRTYILKTLLLSLAGTD